MLILVIIFILICGPNTRVTWVMALVVAQVIMEIRLVLGRSLASESRRLLARGVAPSGA
jgi:hypothetical protein